MKCPDYLIITTTETSEGKDLTKADIITYHTNTRAQGGLGFNRPGFDYLICFDGTLETIIPEEHPNEVDLWGISEGIKGINGSAKYIALVGGRTEKATKEKDTRTSEQKETLTCLIQFYVKRWPSIRVLGWNQVPSKMHQKNPGFEVHKWLHEIGIPNENIFSSTP